MHLNNSFEHTNTFLFAGFFEKVKQHLLSLISSTFGAYIPLNHTAHFFPALSSIISLKKYNYFFSYEYYEYLSNPSLFISTISLIMAPSSNIFIGNFSFKYAGKGISFSKSALLIA